MNKILSQETKLTVGLILIAFLFSVAVRMVWVYQFSDTEAFKFNGQFMINTNDGYYWAEGARDLLNGSLTNHNAKEFLDKFHQPHDLSPVSSAASQLTAFFAKILPFSFESIIFYLPVFLSSLIVIPMILIGKLLNKLELGFIAALLASIAWSYYNRTMAGYYDTDMLNIVIPMFLLWSIIWAIQTNEDKYLLITALDILVYRWWYPQSYSLEFAFFGLILFYALVFDRKNMYNYKLLAIMMFAMLNLDGLIRLPIVLGVMYIFRQEKFHKYTYHILLISVLAFFASGGFNPIWSQLKGYVFKDAVTVGNEGLKLHFFSVMQTVREAGQIPFETFANRISGHIVIFVLSVAGFIYLAYKYRIMLFAIPLIGLGFLASVGGLRFTIYAVPIMAFGIAFLIIEISSNMPTVRLKYLSMIALTLAVLYPNYLHVEEYKVPTVFNSDEVKILNNLGKIAGREDYVVSWWDYGYPIRYYSDVKTIVDGGKHSGEVNFPVSFMLTNVQNIAAKMARIDVEYTEKSFKIRDENKDLNESDKIKLFSNIEQMTTDYGFKNTNDFLTSLSEDIKLPKKTRDIYLYLPFRMMSIFPTITQFSNINLMNGEKLREPFFFMSRNIKETPNTVELGSGIAINKADSTLNIGNKKVPIKRFTKTMYDNHMQLHKDVKLLNFTGALNVIYMTNYNIFLVLDEDTYNSLYIQLMVLEEYDKTLFEKVIMNPNAKVYKLKI